MPRWRRPCDRRKHHFGGAIAVLALLGAVGIANAQTTTAFQDIPCGVFLDLPAVSSSSPFLPFTVPICGGVDLNVTTGNLIAEVVSAGPPPTQYHSAVRFTGFDAGAPMIRSVVIDVQSDQDGLYLDGLAFGSAASGPTPVAPATWGALKVRYP